MATPAVRRISTGYWHPQPTLSLAFGLGQDTWKLSFTIGVAQRPRETDDPGRGCLVPPAGDRSGEAAFRPARGHACRELLRGWAAASLHGVQNYVIDPGEY